jgi:hypothetical protein
VDKQTQIWFSGAVRDAWEAKAREGNVVVAANVADTIIKELAADNPRKWNALRDQFVHDSVTHAVTLAARRVIAASNPRQPWLPLPEFEHIPQFVQLDGGALDLKHATLEQYRACTKILEKKIREYAYSRRADEQLERDKLELRERRRLEPHIAPYFAGDPTMTVGKATALYAASLQTPSAEHSRAIAKDAISKRWRKTENQ